MVTTKNSKRIIMVKALNVTKSMWARALRDMYIRGELTKKQYLTSIQRLRATLPIKKHYQKRKR